MTVRIPAILGVNGSDEQMAAAFAFVRDRCPGATLELLPYHRYGEGKYRRLGLTPPGGNLPPPPPPSWTTGGRWPGMRGWRSCPSAERTPAPPGEY